MKTHFLFPVLSFIIKIYNSILLTFILKRFYVETFIEKQISFINTVFQNLIKIYCMYIPIFKVVFINYLSSKYIY